MRLHRLDCPAPSTRQRREASGKRSMRLVPIIGGARVDLQRQRQQHARGTARPASRAAPPAASPRTSSSGTSKISSSCTCSSICAESFFSASASSIRIMARRMMSAAVPCRRALIAARSLKARTEALEALMSG